MRINNKDKNGKYSRRFRVPFIEQMEQSECGLCCLAMVLSYYKHNKSLSELRELGGGGRDGTNLLILRNIARSLGMDSEGMKVPLDKLNQIPLPCILHWGNNHFVVLEKIKKDKLYILDPAIGRRIIGQDELKDHFSGMALLLVPTSNLVKVNAPSIWIKVLKLIIKEKWLVSTILVWTLWLQILAILTPMLTQFIIDSVLTPKNIEPMKIIAVGFNYESHIK